MTKEAIEKIWPSWRIEFVCDYATDKLRQLCGINFVYLKNSGWLNYGFGDHEQYIHIEFECKGNDMINPYDFDEDLFIKPELEFDKKSGADKIPDQLGKVILRIAWHLKEYWERIK